MKARGLVTKELSALRSDAERLFISGLTTKSRAAAAVAVAGMRAFVDRLANDATAEPPTRDMDAAMRAQHDTIVTAYMPAIAALRIGSGKPRAAGRETRALIRGALRPRRHLWRTGDRHRGRLPPPPRRTGEAGIGPSHFGNPK